MGPLRLTLGVVMPLVAYDHAFKVNLHLRFIRLELFGKWWVVLYKVDNLSRMLFGQILPGLKSLIIGCVPFVMIACTEKSMQ